MTNEKKLGIWMDHSNAHIIEYASTSTGMNTISSEFTHEVKVGSLSRSEHIMHNKEQGQQSEYFQKLAEKISQCDEVVLFGPTDAKAELLNILNADRRFEEIKIDIKPADKMTDNQKQAFVHEYFSKG